MKQSLGAKTLLFPTPVLLVGTYDHEGKPNLMNAAWGGHLLFPAPLRCRIPAQGDLFLRIHRGAQGLHGWHPVGSPDEGG